MDFALLDLCIADTTTWLRLPRSFHVDPCRHRVAGAQLKCQCRERYLSVVALRAGTPRDGTMRRGAQQVGQDREIQGRK